MNNVLLSSITYYIIIGFLLGVAVYHFLVYWGRKNDFSNLIFSLLCFNYALVLFLKKVYPEMPLYNETLYTILYTLLSLTFGAVHGFFCITIFKLKKFKYYTLYAIGKIKALLYHLCGSGGCSRGY